MGMDDEKFAWTGALNDLNKHLEKMHLHFQELRRTQNRVPFTINIPTDNPLPFEAWKGTCIVYSYASTESGNTCNFQLRDGKGGPIRVSLATSVLQQGNQKWLYFSSGIVLDSISGPWVAGDEIIISGEILA